MIVRLRVLSSKMNTSLQYIQISERKNFQPWPNILEMYLHLISMNIIYCVRKKEVVSQPGTTRQLRTKLYQTSLYWFSSYSFHLPESASCFVQKSKILEAKHTIINLNSCKDQKTVQLYFLSTQWGVACPTNK